MIDEDMILINCWSLISRFVKKRGRQTGLLKSVQYMVHCLYYNFNVERKEIISDLNDTFETRKRHLKFDPERSSLEKYVMWFVYYELLTLVQKRQKEFKEARKNTIPLADLESGERIKDRIGCSLTPYERQGIYGLIDNISPEDELLKKELAQIAMDFFGPDDLAVLLGARDRKEEAERLGIDYFAYSKRLERKVQRFKSHLQDIDYPI